MFRYIIVFFKNQSNVRERKAVVVSISKILLAAASLCVYRAHAENKEQNHSEIKSQGPCKKEYKKYCANGGECYYLVDKDNVGCSCT